MFHKPGKLRDLERFEEILSEIVKSEMGFILEHVGLKKKEVDRISEKPTPARVKELLEELGGTFVKLGQLLSLRPDLIPPEYCEEFSKLQDEVKPFPSEEVEEVVEGELGRPIDEAFQSFMLQPIASASVGQVHKAVLESGEEVAVKVRRPGIKEKMAADIDIMTYVANKVEKHFNPEVFSPTQVVSEFKDYTEKELDYKREVLNIREFHDNFEGTEVVIPEVFGEYCSEDLLVMEYVEGRECRELIEEDEDYPEVAEDLCNAVFKQVFEDGFFHADPHPSNLLQVDDTVGFLDFGIVGRLSEDMKEDLSLLFISLIQKDVDNMVEAFMRLEVVGKGVDREKLKTDLSEALGVYYDVPLKEVKLSELIHKGFRVARQNDMRLPKNFVLLGKAVATLEGTCAELDEGFNIVEVGKPYVAKLLKERMRPSRLVKKMVESSQDVLRFLQDVPELGRDFHAAVKSADEGLERIDADLRKVSREVGSATSRLVFGLLASALIVSAALVADMQQGALFGFPAISFSAVIVALVLLFALILSWYEEKSNWRA